MKNTVNPRIAERRGWAKFGASARDGPGPQNATTSVGENIELNLRQNLGAKGGAGGAGGGGSGGGADGEGMNGEGEDGVNGGGLTEKELQKEKLKGATVKCRICNGEHFTARCPYKATMAPDGEPAAGEPAADPMAEGGGAGGVGATKGKYVAPGARAGAAGGGERMGGKYERDDLATLRVTNVRAPSLILFSPSPISLSFVSSSSSPSSPTTLKTLYTKLTNRHSPTPVTLSLSPFPFLPLSHTCTHTHSHKNKQNRSPNTPKKTTCAKCSAATAG